MKPIKLAKSNFYNEGKTKKSLLKFINSARILSMNKECQKFEVNFAKKQKRKFAVFVNSGSSANLALVQSLMNLGWLKKGDPVGFSSLTWSTNVMPLIQFDLIPKALDCNLNTLNTSPDDVNLHKKEIKALFLTNVLGFCDDLEKIKNICKNHNIFLIEDNCESLGSQYSGKLLGNFGLASTFSFFVGHHLSTIEGGMICTDNEDLYYTLLMVRAHGWDRNLPKKQQKKIRLKNKTNDFFAKYTFYDLAFNIRPTEINGFLGNVQIKYWDEIVKKREQNFKTFQHTINKNPDFIPLKINHLSTISNFAMPVICKTQTLFKKYQDRFKNSNVEIRPIIAGNITQQPFYKKYYKPGVILKNVTFLHKNSFYFPNNAELTKDEVSCLCTLLKK